MSITLEAISVPRKMDLLKSDIWYGHKDEDEGRLYLIRSPQWSNTCSRGGNSPCIQTIKDYQSLPTDIFYVRTYSWAEYTARFVKWRSRPTLFDVSSFFILPFPLVEEVVKVRDLYGDGWDIHPGDMPKIIAFFKQLMAKEK